MAALAILAWVFVVPSCSAEFECATSSTDAANGGTCPSGVEGAASSADWAADRLASIAEDPQTTGLFYDEDGNEHEFDSTHDDDEEAATRVLRELGIVGPNASLTVASHVEVKAAARMRDRDVAHGFW